MMNVGTQLPWSRAQAKRALLVLAVVSMVTLAGCTGALTNSDEGGDAEPQTDLVPDEAVLVASFDMSLMTDSETQALVEGIDESEAEDVQDIDDVYEEFNNETGLDLTELEGATMFATSAADISESGDAAFILDAEWDAETVVENIGEEEGIDYVQTEYAGEKVLWEPANPDQHYEPMYVGVHDDGQLVVGDRAAVTASLDVTYDGAASLSGDLLEAFENAPDGHVRFAMDASSMDSGAESGQYGGMAMYDSLETITGAYYTEDGTVGVETRMAFSDAEQAENLEGTINLLLDQYETELEPEQQRLVDDEHLTIETEDSSLVITWEAGVDELTEAANTA